MNDPTNSSTIPPPDNDGRRHLIVIFGGQSAEHDVSRVTAAHVLAALDPARYRVTPIGISTAGRWCRAEGALAVQGLAVGSSPQDPGSLSVSGTPVEITEVLEAARHDSPDAVVLPLLHGPFGEDGTVQGLLELSGLAYVGSGVLGSAVAMDKAMAKTVLAAHGVPQVRHISAHEADVRAEGTAAFCARVAQHLGLPCFVKPANMGSSVGVSRAADLDELETALATALIYDAWVVVEEAVSAREIEVAVMGNQSPVASVPGEIRPADEFYSYADKYLTGSAELLIPAPLDSAEIAEIQRLALNAYRALRCEGLARVDFFYEHPGRGFLCSEANTMPGFTPISMFPKLWAHNGVDYPELLERLITYALERAAERRRHTDRLPTSRGERGTQESA